MNTDLYAVIEQKNILHLIVMGLSPMLGAITSITRFGDFYIFHL